MEMGNTDHGDQRGVFREMFQTLMERMRDDQRFAISTIRDESIRDKNHSR